MLDYPAIVNPMVICIEFLSHHPTHHLASNWSVWLVGCPDLNYSQFTIGITVAKYSSLCIQHILLIHNVVSCSVPMVIWFLPKYHRISMQERINWTLELCTSLHECCAQFGSHANLSCIERLWYLGQICRTVKLSIKLSLSDWIIESLNWIKLNQYSVDFHWFMVLVAQHSNLRTVYFWLLTTASLEWSATAAKKQWYTIMCSLSYWVYLEATPGKSHVVDFYI